MRKVTEDPHYWASVRRTPMMVVGGIGIYNLLGRRWNEAFSSLVALVIIWVVLGGLRDLLQRSKEHEDHQEGP